MIVEFEERLTGSYRRPSDRDRPLRLDLRARSVSRASFEVHGWLVAPGLVEGAELGGTIAYEPRAALHYALTLSILGRDCELDARKTHLFADAYAGFTMLRGSLFDSASRALLADVGARFDARGDLAWWFSRLRARF